MKLHRIARQRRERGLDEGGSSGRNMFSEVDIGGPSIEDVAIVTAVARQRASIIAFAYRGSQLRTSASPSRPHATPDRMAGMGPYRLPPKKSLAEHWEEMRQAPRRHLIAVLVFLGLFTFGVLDIALRMWN